MDQNEARGGWQWSEEEKSKHKCIGVDCGKICNLAFTPGKSVRAVNLKTDNVTALTYLVKMGGGTRSKDLLGIAKELWGYLIHNHYSLITYYFP